MNMRLLGAKTIKDVVPEMVDASSLKSHFVMTPEDNLFNSTCAYQLFPIGSPLPDFCSLLHRPTTPAREVQGIEALVSISLSSLIS